MEESPHSQGTTPASFIAILGIAATYFTLARLSLLLAIPPGYASAIWPAAGLALAAVLLWGYRVWFGVWLGSFAANLWTALNAGNAILSLPTVSAAVIASGAALQTVFGAYLVFRFVGSPLNLCRLRDVVRFLLLGGPLSCVVNATGFPPAPGKARPGAPAGFLRKPCRTSSASFLNSILSASPVVGFLF